MPRRFETFEERVIELIVYVVTEFPKHPYLPLAFNNECGAVLRERAFTDEETLIFSEMTAAPLIEVRPEIKDQGTEITEYMSRFAISLILFPGRYAEDPDGLREMIKKRMLPGIV